MKTKSLKTLLLAAVTITPLIVAQPVLAGHPDCTGQTVAKYEAVQCPQNDACEYATLCTMMVDMQENVSSSINTKLNTLGSTLVEVNGKVGVASSNNGLFKTVSDVSNQLGNNSDFTEATVFGHLNKIKGSVGSNLQNEVGLDRSASPDGQDSGMVKVVNEIDITPKVTNKVTKSQIQTILNAIVSLINNALN